MDIRFHKAGQSSRESTKFLCTKRKNQSKNLAILTKLHEIIKQGIYI